MQQQRKNTTALGPENSQKVHQQAWLLQYVVSTIHFTLGLDDYSKTFLGNNFPLLPAFFPHTAFPLSGRPLKRCFSLTWTWTWQWKLRYKKYEDETKKSV